MSYQLITKPSRVYAVDSNGIEIVGARQPYGHDEWVLYPTRLVTRYLQQAVVPTRDAAIAWVTMVAELYTEGANPAMAVLVQELRDDNNALRAELSALRTPAVPA